jgi:DNA-binding beta-propeller fold protein YncE
MKKLVILSIVFTTFLISCKKDSEPAPESASALFYTNWRDSSVGKIDLKDGNTVQVFSKGVSSGISEEGLEAITLNPATGDIYVCASSVPDDKIYKISNNGIATLLYSGTETGSLSAIAFNTSNNKLYWVNNRDNKIYIANSDGTGTPAPLFGSQLINAAGESLAIDETNSTIYFSGGLHIYVGNLNGTGTPEVLYSRITDTLVLPRALKIDPINNRLYWADEDGEFIGSANLDGTGNFKILYSVSGSPYGLDIDFVSKKIYWSNIYSSVKNIQVANLDGSGTPTTLVNNIESYGIILK